MRAKLPIIGQIATGRDAEAKTTSKVVEKLVQSEMGAAFLDLSTKNLSGYKTISERLLTSFNGWVFANVSVLSEEISKMEFELYRAEMQNGQMVYVEVEEHPLLDLLDQWNSFTPSSQAIYLLETFLELTGDAFIVVDGAGENINNLFLLQPDKVELVIGDANDDFMVTKYIYKDNVDGRQVEVEYSPDEIIHIKTPNPINPYRGKSVVEAAAMDIDTDNLAQEMIKMFFKNGAVPSVVLTSDQRITKDDIHRLQVDLKRTYGGVKNAFKSMILGNGLKPVTLSQSTKEMQFLELELAMRDKIMAMFKNTKASLGITEDVNRANAEATLLSWKQSVIKPKMKRIVDTLNEFLVPRYGDNLILTYDDPVPEDSTEEIVLAKDLYAAGIITLNEAREEADYDPVENGDVLIGGQDILEMPEQPEVEEEKQMPSNIRLVDYKKHFRRNKVFSKYDAYKALYSDAHEVAHKLLTPKEKGAVQPPESRESQYFTNDQVWTYFAKQEKLVDAHEQIFATKVEQFIDGLEEKAISNLPAAVNKKYKKKQFMLFDPETEIQAGIDLFTPLQEEIAKLSAMEAFNLLDTKKGYLPSENLLNNIANSTKLFTESFVDTDVKKLNSILQSGLEQGQSVAQLGTAISTAFGDFKKSQVQRIVRSEVLRASNLGQMDAYKASGVVSGMQWLTAPGSRTCEYCAPLNGKTVKLNQSFFKKGESWLGDAETPLVLDYTTIKTPPLHPNCRCTIIPVLKDITELSIDSTKQELEELRDYTKHLEELLELENEIK